MTSLTGILICALGMLVTTISGQLDKTVCTVQVPKVPLPVPAGILGEVWEAVIEWKDDINNRTFIVKDYTDMPNKREKLVISVPFENDVTVIYDWNTRDVVVEKTVILNEDVSTVTCEVVPHRNTGGEFSYNDLFWLTSFQYLLNQFAGSSDAIQTGATTVRGTAATNWTACIYDYSNGLSSKTNLYFSQPSWQSPYLAPDSPVPLRLTYSGKMHNGSHVTDINLVGDILSFKKKDQNSNFDFAPDTFMTTSGAFCANRTSTFMKFPSLPSQFSMVREVVDVDNKQVSYEELFYDSKLKMVRHDYKLVRGNDPDSTSVISDFQVGVKYMIDTHMKSCQSVTALVYGDNFVADQRLTMQTVPDYFHSQNATIQYAGTTTVRNVECDTWIGQYFDILANRQNTVQWYFTTRKWWEATGNSEGGGAFFMMKIWSGGSSNPRIYDIMRYSQGAPDFDVFDFSVCFLTRQKKHFVVEFAATNIGFFNQLSGPYLTISVIGDLAARLEIQPNRFTDIRFDLDSDRSRLFMSATLLDRALETAFNKNEINLRGAFDFLEGSIASGQIKLNISISRGNLSLAATSLVEHDYSHEFATTTAATVASTKILAPTLQPPKRATTPAPPSCPPTPACPTLRPSVPCPSPPSCPSPSPCPPVVTCPLVTAPPCPRCTSPLPGSGCPPQVVCPAHQPCPVATACPPSNGGVTRAPGTQCQCPPTPAPCPQQVVTPCPTGSATLCSLCPKQATAGSLHSSPSSTSSGISSGALAGGIIAALLLGLAAGIIATRFYHVYKVSSTQMTINLIDDNNM